MSAKGLRPGSVIELRNQQRKEPIALEMSRVGGPWTCSLCLDVTKGAVRLTTPDSSNFHCICLRCVASMASAAIGGAR